MNSRVVYVIGPAEGPVKIGIADDPQKRLAGLQTGCFDELLIHHTTRVPFALALSLEAAAHKALEEHHRRGEWFNVHKDEAIATVERVKAQLLPDHQYKAVQGDLIDRLHSRYEMAADARKAVIYYRERCKAKNDQFVPHANGHVLKQCGAAAYASFSLVIAQRTPLTSLKPAERAKAELVLVRAINALADFHHDYLDALWRRRSERLYGPSRKAA